MCRNTKSKLNDPTVAHGCLLISQIDFDVMVTKQRMVQRIDCFVGSLLRYKEQSTSIGIRFNPCSFSRRCHEVQQIGWQNFGGLYVYTHALEVFRATNRGNSDPGIMRKRA
jgi:hypothetical protein